MRLSTRSLTALVAVVLVGAVFTVRGFLSSQKCLDREQPMVEVEQSDDVEDVEPLRGCQPADVS